MKLNKVMKVLLIFCLGMTFNLATPRKAFAGSAIFDKYSNYTCYQTVIHWWYDRYKNCETGEVHGNVLVGMTETPRSYSIEVCDGGWGWCQTGESCGPETTEEFHYRIICD